MLISKQIYFSLETAGKGGRIQEDCRRVKRKTSFRFEISRRICRVRKAEGRVWGVSIWGSGWGREANKVEWKGVVTTVGMAETTCCPSTHSPFYGGRIFNWFMATQPQTIFPAAIAARYDHVTLFGLMGSEQKWRGQLQSIRSLFLAPPAECKNSWARDRPKP